MDKQRWSWSSSGFGGGGNRQGDEFSTILWNVGLVFNPECKVQCNAYVVWLTTYKINREGVVASIGRMDRCKNGWHVVKARNVPDQLEIKVGGVTLLG